ncbi:SMP-30/gluconolactonase/LRE family protein [Rhizobium sp. OAE497]|uniref:SMP-30/gluconolactonase/LRE family protein n=1 Tax=Rhizobium sp. OAE497 TaxID=2663796 RepID=UPI0018F78952
MTVELLDADLPLSQLGEGAYWRSRNLTLYWVDIAGQTVHAYRLPDEVHSSWPVSREVSFAFPQQDGHLLVGLSDGVYDYDPESDKEIPIALLDLPSGHRLNDGKLDPAGRLWVGTINTADEPSETAALYVLRNDRLEEVEGGYANANGKAWNSDGTTMYHADTSRRTIWKYDYDVKTGTASNKRVFVRHEDWNPDGLCMDPGGNLLVAVFGGARVEIYSHRGERLGDIETACSECGELRSFRRRDTVRHHGI